MRRLKKVSETLNYDRTKKPIDRKVAFEPRDVNIKKNWEVEKKSIKPSKYLWYLLIVTFLFFIVTIMLAFYVQYVGIDKVVTVEKISIIAQGATSIDSGDSVSLSLRIANRNPVDIEDAVLSVVYPEGSYTNFESYGDSSIRVLRREQFSIGVIKEGEIANKNISFILFGKENELKEVGLELEYRSAGSSRNVVAKENYEVLLRTSAINLSKPIFTDPVVGKEIMFSFPVQSNIEKIIPLAFLRVKYPSNFSITSTSPKLSDPINGIWRIINLRPGERRTIRVSGFIRDVENSEKSILSEVFIAPSVDERDRALVAEESSVIKIENAFISSKIKLKGAERKDLVASPKESIGGKLIIENIDNETLQNISVFLQFSGNGLDQSSIKGTRAYYDEIKNRLIWDIRETESLKSLAKGKSIEFSFSFKTLPDRIDFAQENKNINLSVSVEAVRSSSGKRDTAQNISYADILLRSVVEINAQTQFLTSILKNIGMLPPKVGESIQYTLKYFVRNSGNRISDVKLVIPLEREVKLTGSVNGLKNNEYEYNEEEHSVTISIPSIEPIGSGAVRTIELQVETTPKERDIGRPLKLAKKGTFTAFDEYIKESVEKRLPELTSGIKNNLIGLEKSVVVENR